ncbi:MAG: polysaccharide ABC transporter ATP-binding protein [Gammaproteobacteria bacterium]
MSEASIAVENLGKQFYIGKLQPKYRTLRDQIGDVFLAPFRRAGKVLRGAANSAAELDELIWALRDVSFEVRPGEVVGLIGRNGAGKSTLLKILARITEPTTGRAVIRGRVGSLLEVGTGFHAELTGRENIYLNGAILGMKRAEIDRKFDEIVAFAEVEKFIDTPIKHYSSGMTMRLAFAVAGHLEPEILIIDEVLAVGDMRFQRKCLNKMQDIGEQGRTVLFVSHNMPAVTRMCKRVILLHEGRLVCDGPAHKVVSAYMNDGLGTTAERYWPDPEKAPGGEIVRLRAVRVRAADGSVTGAVDIRQPVGLEMEYEVLKPGYILLPHHMVYNEEGVQLFTTVDRDPAWRGRRRLPGRYVSTAWIPGNLLAEGMVFVGSALTTLEPRIHQFLVRDVVAFQVIDSLDGDSARGDWGGNLRGVVRPLIDWETHAEGGVTEERSCVGGGRM